MATKKIEQPNVELQEVLDDILNETPTEYTFRGKKRMLGWLHKGTTRKFTHIELKEKNEWKKRIKQCAVVQLNNVWKIRFFYWLLWRYYYYIIDLDVWEVLGVLNVAKKKNTISSISTHYHISDRNDGCDDDDDESGSRAYPSRTSWGGAFSLAEKFSFLFERRFGIRAYDYWWGYTSAQIDLMAIDQPTIVYPKKNDGKHASKSEIDELTEAWEKKHKASRVGREISLNDYFNNDIKQDDKG